MPSESKMEKLFVLLIRQTTEGNISWKSEEPPRSLLSGTSDIIEDYFVTVYKGQNLAVFERRYREFDVDTETSYWTTRDSLAFLDASHSITWESSDQSARLSTLVKVAKESAADVNGILDSLLG